MGHLEGREAEMEARRRGFTRKAVGLFVVLLTALAVPATASAGDVTVTATPASLPAPGGMFRFTVSIGQYPDIPGAYRDSYVSKLTDNLWGDISYTGTCSPAHLPYSCSFTDLLTGAPGATLVHAVVATESRDPLGPAYPPLPPYYRSGAATVTLTAPQIPAPHAAPRKKCRKGLVLKKVKTKRGTVRKCVKR
jgi:hypothetical protein